ncbi:hypothetical protein, partial [Streptococcus pneumoniae]|uniref:hypothetical protein n=1 Tax=Streptococcus pneumoniae TaxID=1313 RepID=UPI001E2F2290
KYLARQAQLREETKPRSASAGPSPYAPPSSLVGEVMPMHGELKPFSVSGRIGRLRYLAWSLVVVLASAGLFGIAGIIMAISSIAGVICMGLIFIGISTSHARPSCARRPSLAAQVQGLPRTRLPRPS